MDPEFETKVAAASSTSTSSSGEQEDEKSTVLPLAAVDLKAKTLSTASSTSPVKKSGGRRSVQKRVVTVPIADVDASRPKGAGEGAPPSDSWAWRKYGQKPIKGSPYPRGYYRCSSSKGCPARKQVERSRVDPTMLIVTYASDHNHPWPLPKNNHHHHHHHHHNNNNNSHSPVLPPSVTTQSPPPVEQEQEEGPPTPAATANAPSTNTTTTNTSSSSPEETVTFPGNLGVAEDYSPMMLMTDELFWQPYIPEASLPPVTMMLPVSYDDDSKELSSAAKSGGNASGGSGGDEEESLFAGLGELPEWSMVFRRGFSVGAA